MFGSKPRLIQVKAAVLDRWRIALFIFASAYTVFLLLEIASSPMQWDEVAHLNGASFLNWGLFDKFVNSAFYPPLFDSITFVSFKLFGVSLFSGRLVSVVFSVLSLWAVFELAYRMYGGKAALLSSILLGIMPGYFILSRLALLEIMLVFFLTVSLFFFFLWLKNRQNKMLVFSGLAIGLGLLTKYQMLAAAFIMLFSMLLLGRGHYKRLFSRFTILIATVIIVIVPWAIMVYQIYETTIFSQWIYAVQIGNPERLLYSDRFPTPIYYFIEMVWPYNDIHPISIFLYTTSLLGLGLFAWRRKMEDKFSLIWFASIFALFTLIENKQWRYVLPLFPVLAISASVIILFLYGKISGVRKGKISLNRKRASKFAAGLFVVLIAGAMAYSISDAYYGVAKYQIEIDLQGATNYAFTRLKRNESIMVLSPFNFFNRDMVRFYLWADGDNHIRVYQYPSLPVDTYTPNFNITEFIDLCENKNVKFVFTYEHGGTVPYFNTTLNLQQIYMQLYASGNFSHISEEATFGSNPRRIFILTFTG